MLKVNGSNYRILVPITLTGYDLLDETRIKNPIPNMLIMHKSKLTILDKNNKLNYGYKLYLLNIQQMFSDFNINNNDTIHLFLSSDNGSEDDTCKITNCPIPYKFYIFDNKIAKII